MLNALLRARYKFSYYYYYKVAIVNVLLKKVTTATGLLRNSWVYLHIV